MFINQAEERLRAIADSDEDVQAIDTLINEIAMLKEDILTADKALKEECRRNAELKNLLHALMKYIIGDDSDA